VNPGKVGEKALWEKPLEQEMAAHPERQVLEDLEEQGVEGAWVSLRAPV